MADSNGDSDVNMLPPDMDMESTGVGAPPLALAPLHEEDKIDRALVSGAVLPPAPPTPSASGSALPTPSTSPPLAPPTLSVLASALVPGPKPMWGLSYLGDNLWKELLAMDAGPREEYLCKLRRITPSMQEIESNLVRNRALAISMELFSVAAFFGTKRKSKRKDQRRKKKAKGDEKDWDDDDEDRASESDSEGEEEGENTPMRTRGKGRAAGTTAGSSKAPKWVVTRRKALLEGRGEEMGSDWTGIVELWWALKEKSSFATTTKSHPTTNRPKAVGAWVKNMVVSGDANSLGSMETRDQWRDMDADTNGRKEGRRDGGAPTLSTNNTLEPSPAPGTTHPIPLYRQRFSPGPSTNEA
ncbi:hypothetical protein K438DRAFT_1972929 [Mycena galopus ATCC 62051]|nr:hypothetical protein K438DRAFT_1972929 [Mycena galopus ATCC 62051]